MGGNLTLVPNWQANPILSRSFRFACASSNLTSVSIANLLSLLVFPQTTTTSTTAGALIAGIRIKKVRIWDISGLNIFLEWISSTAPNQNIEALGNTTFPSMIESRPPKNSNASFWQSWNVPSTALGMFQIRGNNGTSFLDLMVDFCMVSGGIPSSVTLSGAKAPGIYYYSLTGTSAWPSESLDSAV